MSGTATPANNTYDWAIRIANTTASTPGAAFTPRIPNGQPGQTLRAQPADIVTWGNAGTVQCQIGYALLNGGTVATTSTVVGTGANAVTVVSVTTSGGSLTAGPTITAPMAPNASSQPQFVVPAAAAVVTSCFGTTSVFTGAATSYAAFTAAIAGAGQATVPLFYAFVNGGTIGPVSQQGTILVVPAI